MTARLRKFALTAHITFSVGWLGTVTGFLVLSIAGVTSQDAELVRGAYLSMDLIGRAIIVPMSLATLTTGLVQALGTEWGLLRHYWVLVKFLLTIGATILLLLHQFTAVAGAARRVSNSAPGTFPEIGRLGTQLVGDAGLAILGLLAATILSVYKPWGRTPYGRRKLLERRSQPPRASQTLGVIPMSEPDNRTTGDGPGLGLKIALAVIGVIVAVFVLLHVAGGGLGSHGH